MTSRKRDWKTVRESKAVRWRTLTAAERVRLAGELRRQALLIHPDWPARAQRKADDEASSVSRSARAFPSTATLSCPPRWPGSSGRSRWRAWESRLRGGDGEAEGAAFADAALDGDAAAVGLD